MSANTENSSKEEICTCLRLVCNDGCQHILPYGHLLHGMLVDGNGTIQLTFATTHVEIVGRNLEEIFLAIKEMTRDAICISTHEEIAAADTAAVAAAAAAAAKTSTKAPAAPPPVVRQITVTGRDEE